MPLHVHTFATLSDNYGFLVHDTQTGRTASIDAAAAPPIEAELARTGWTLTDILVTHHHWDHTDGILPLKQAHGARVTGPSAEADHIAGMDHGVHGGQTITLGASTLAVIDTPGHTNGHICYFDAEGCNLFSGDALFSLGCGRMFEGTPRPMWQGLTRLRALPDETKVFCGHEYSAANADFALSIDPDNPALIARAEHVRRLRDANQPTIPFLLGEDKAANPFLRADDPALAARFNLPPDDPARVFAAIRKAKDSF